MAHHNASAPGFVGNDNIYGIGIRIGYYTQAISIGVANFYARHQAPYLHNVTLLFLIALFVGLCVLAANTKEAYAVEPFMLASVAYYTIYMGLWDQHAPYLLPWETEFKKRITVDIIWVAFHGFDVWYWWFGIYQMKPSNGPDGTVIFYPYIGKVQLYGWITIVARVMNATILIVSLVCTSSLISYKLQQARMDKAMTAQRLKALTEKWLRDVGDPLRLPGLDVQVTSPTDSSRALLTENRNVSSSSFEISGSGRPSSTRSFDLVRDDNKQGINPFGKENKVGSPLTRESTGPPPYRRPTRTGTGLLKRTLGWTNNNDIDLSQPPPRYFAYEPAFQDIQVAAELLKACTTTKDGKKPAAEFWGANFVKITLHFPYWWLQVTIYLVTQLFHLFRPTVLFAVATHAYQLEFGKCYSYPQCLLLALKHPAYCRVRCSEDVVLASRIMITLDPPPKTPRWALIMARWAIFGSCSVLAIGTELTIQWNGIHGVQDLSSVGQLIPFCLGVGGLFMVLYSAMTEQERKNEERYCYFGECTILQRLNEWKEAGGGFKRCVNAWERSQTLPGLEKDKATA